VWRRRYCEKCGRTFTTRENVELGFLEVTKINGSIEPFIRTKLVYSVISACDHLPNEIDTSMALVETIEKKILSSLKNSSSTTTTTEIAHITGVVLKRYDPLSYLKYMGHRGEAPTSKRSLKLLIKDSN